MMRAMIERKKKKRDRAKLTARAREDDDAIRAEDERRDHVMTNNTLIQDRT